jgi:hypothetical protein
MPYAEEELKIYLLELDVTVGRININSKCSASKFTCKKAGCGKEFRVIRLFDMPEDNDDEDSIYIEEEVNSLHDHTAAEIHLRGLSVAQKVIVLQCYQRKQSGAKAIIAEFEETSRRQRAINGAVVATPKESYRWSKDGSIQKRNIHDVFVNVTENNDHLTDHRAQRFITIFSDFSFASYDEYTSVSNNVSILVRKDTTAPVIRMPMSFFCVHSLGVAILRGTMVPPREARVTLLGRKRKRGRRPQAAPAWQYQQFDMNTPIQHPQQDPALLAGIVANDVQHDIALA